MTTMRQLAPFPHYLVDLVKRLKYKEGWLFEVVEHFDLEKKA
jgi:hypothetical protein